MIWIKYTLVSQRNLSPYLIKFEHKGRNREELFRSKPAKIYWESQNWLHKWTECKKIKNTCFFLILSILQTQFRNGYSLPSITIDARVIWLFSFHEHTQDTTCVTKPTVSTLL